MHGSGPFGTTAPSKGGLGCQDGLLEIGLDPGFGTTAEGSLSSSSHWAGGAFVYVGVAQNCISARSRHHPSRNPPQGGCDKLLRHQIKKNQTSNFMISRSTILGAKFFDFPRTPKHPFPPPPKGGTLLFATKRGLGGHLVKPSMHVAKPSKM